MLWSPPDWIVVKHDPLCNGLGEAFRNSQLFQTASGRVQYSNPYTKCNRLAVCLTCWFYPNWAETRTSEGLPVPI